ncbi:hypothetical protein QYM36_003248 [Artemia franciscana]|uniref:Uncharacterized protein n=1 Tax=Artemia franciscana TaxID=6661 RepID=A0AA88LIG2_ARTSF|nr:hypothetical protein QYM36_003248 [Artemia franciscana]
MATDKPFGYLFINLNSKDRNLTLTILKIERLKQLHPFVDILAKAKPKLRHALLKNLDKDIVKAFSQLCLNITNSNISMPLCQKKRCSQHRKIIHDLSEMAAVRPYKLIPMETAIQPRQRFEYEMADFLNSDSISDSEKLLLFQSAISRLQKYRSDMTKPIKVDVVSKPSQPSELQPSGPLASRRDPSVRTASITTGPIRDIYKGFSRRFDIPNPPTHHGLFQLGPQQISPSGKSQKKNDFGRLKNELESDTFIELIATSPKCYSVLTQNEKLKKAAKGTSKHLMKKYLTAERFKEAVFEGRVIRTTTNAIRSLKLKLYTMEVVRTAISGVSDKVYIFDDRITTLPLGRYKIEEMN